MQELDDVPYAIYFSENNQSTLGSIAQIGSVYKDMC